jgi:hypothetical protein
MSSERALRVLGLGSAVLAVLLLSACEWAQVSQPATKKPDLAAFEGTDNAFAQAGWKRGDKTAWEQQMRVRSEGQNEYTRTGQP